MINVFKSLANARRRRKQLRQALAQNNAIFKAALDKVDREYRQASDEIMNNYVGELMSAGGLGCVEEEVITAEAEHRANQAKELADQKIKELREANERRIKQILACYR